MSYLLVIALVLIWISSAFEDLRHQRAIVLVLLMFSCGSTVLWEAGG